MFTINVGKTCSGWQMEVFLLLHIHKGAFWYKSDLSESGQDESVLPGSDLIPERWLQTDRTKRPVSTCVTQQSTTAHEVWLRESAHLFHHLYYWRVILKSSRPHGINEET